MLNEKGTFMGWVNTGHSTVKPSKELLAPESFVSEET
jgi:hypothetical protein